MTRHKMNLYHRYNVWRIAGKCPLCGSDRGYPDANLGGIEGNCCDEENCGFSEFFSTGFIHSDKYGKKCDEVRWEVLDHNNKVRPGWYYAVTKVESERLKVKCENHIKERERMELETKKLIAKTARLERLRKRPVKRFAVHFPEQVVFVDLKGEFCDKKTARWQAEAVPDSVTVVIDHLD